MSALLRERGLDVTGQGATWEDAEQLAAHAPAVVVLDLWMPRFEEQALYRIRARLPQATLAVVTALALVDAAERVAAAGIDLLLSKSWPPDEVAAAIAGHAHGAASATV
jgi:DNA-binding NarL/FixJ family response regulator